MKRAYYSNTIDQFLNDSISCIIGELSMNHNNKSLDELQTNAWKTQIEILKDQLFGLQGKIYFEFSIPRMGKRVDNILIVENTVFIIEFKVGKFGYEKYAIEQVVDYTIDLKNFHEGSHFVKLIPVLVATNAEFYINDLKEINNHKTAARSNKNNLREVIELFLQESDQLININNWENSIYKPTPTIIEAAQALYRGHNVQEITRSDSGAINLSITTDCINGIVECSKISKSKSICFVTGVPGAGKTLAGLNIANERMNADEDEHAVFLSGNGPLVDVLREALVRDEVLIAKETRQNLTKKQAAIKANAFIQNIHHFRDDNLLSDKAPVEKVVVFDEAQRAWTMQQINSFMKRKKGIDNFNMSEPEFLIEVMNRHKDWCTIICLIGGGQEINTGEAGLEEWIIALKNRFSDWNIYYSNSIIYNDNYLKNDELKNWIEFNANIQNNLHLAVSLRSFRSEKLSDFIHDLLDLKVNSAKKLYKELELVYPVFITRNLELAKQWLNSQVKGSERIGLLISSGAKRIRASGVDSENSLRSDSDSNKISNWFLSNKNDVRSSYYLEIAATEFVIQGLEIDWACISWDANFYFNLNSWKCQKFLGNKWQNINKDTEKRYLKNAYRVLLTRARQGMIIFIPRGSDYDKTRPHEFYDNTYNYLKELGIKEIL